MKSSRASIAPILLAILVLASLRPVAPVDAGLDLALAPSRLLAELALPLRWLRAGDWERGDEALAALRQVEGDAGADLVLDLRAEAEPTDPDLRLRGKLVPARLIRRDGDSAWVALDPQVGLAGVEPGVPAVVGEVYVGRVAELDPAGGRVLVELATGSSFFVGAVLDEPGSVKRAPLRMTVGGLEPGSDPPRLAIHNPSERAPRRGAVRVLEPDFGDDRIAHLADGFLLGDLVPPATDEEGAPLGSWSVLPRVDFGGGLFYLSLVLPPEADRPRDPGPRSVLRDGAWIPVRPLSVGDPAPGRRGLVVSRGSWSDVTPGAAVVATTRLVGRVTPGRPVAPASARVQLLGEPGLNLNVMARLDTDGSARILGRFRCLGLVDGRPRFEWNAVLGLEGLPEGRPVQATLFTGAGLQGVPAGLLIGRASLRPEAGRQVVVLEQWTDGLEHADLWVRGAGGGER